MPRSDGIIISKLNWIVNKLDIEAKIFGQKYIVDQGVDVTFLRSVLTQTKNNRRIQNSEGLHEVFMMMF